MHSVRASLGDAIFMALFLAKPITLQAARPCLARSPFSRVHHSKT